MKIRAAVLVWALAAVAGAQTTIRPGGGGGSSIITSGTTATSGCSPGGFFYSSSSLVACGANATNDGTTATFGTGVTIGGSSTSPFVDITGTWNTSAGPTALKVNVTNTASSSGKLFDFQSGGTSVFKLSQSGNIYQTAASSSLLNQVNTTSSAGLAALAAEYSTYVFNSLITYGGSYPGTLAGLPKAGLASLEGNGSGITGMAIGTVTSDPFNLFTNSIARISMTDVGATTIGSSSLGTSVVPLTVTPGTGSTAHTLDLTNSASTVVSHFKGNGNFYIGSLAGVASMGSQTWFGGGAGNTTTTGTDNTAFGDNSMSGLTNGLGNSCFGRQTCSSIVTGQYNTAIGYVTFNAANSNGNVAVGYHALQAQSGGTGYNTVVGTEAGNTISTGHSNTLIGLAAGSGITTGVGNTVVGYVTGLGAAITNHVIIGDSGNVLVGGGQQRLHSFPAVPLTEAGGAETVLTLTSATTNTFTVDVDYMVTAKDATPDYATRKGSVGLVCVNNATVVTCTKSATNETDDGRNGGGSLLINTNSKTLTYAITLDVSAANVAALKFNIDSDMTVTSASITMSVTINGTVTPS